MVVRRLARDTVDMPSSVSPSGISSIIRPGRTPSTATAVYFSHSPSPGSSPPPINNGCATPGPCRISASFPSSPTHQPLPGGAAKNFWAGTFTNTSLSLSMSTVVSITYSPAHPSVSSAPSLVSRRQHVTGLAASTSSSSQGPSPGERPPPTCTASNPAWFRFTSGRRSTSTIAHFVPDLLTIARRAFQSTKTGRPLTLPSRMSRTYFPAASVTFENGFTLTTHSRTTGSTV
mmetsp:Transcript_42040/g.110733  ORF Transcript_42040/g.110733 Transcript_42040/m.110733 type:complete len:232 (+) Transcript_42040:605-1300(+)